MSVRQNGLLSNGHYKQGWMNEYNLYQAISIWVNVCKAKESVDCLTKW